MTITGLQDLNEKTIAKLNRMVTEIDALISDPEIDLDDEARLIGRRGCNANRHFKRGPTRRAPTRRGR